MNNNLEIVKIKKSFFQRIFRKSKKKVNHREAKGRIIEVTYDFSVGKTTAIILIDKNYLEGLEMAQEITLGYKVGETNYTPINLDELKQRTDKLTTLR